MDAYYFDRGKNWHGCRCLWEALDMDGRMEHFRRKNGNAPFVVSVVGAGGKTSLIRQMAEEGKNHGLKVLVLTTTHMFAPKRFGCLDAPPEKVGEMLARDGIAAVGHLEETGKISFQGWEYYRRVTSFAELVLVEADGSKRLPVKVPKEGEPVVPEDTALLPCVAGLSAFGRRAEEVCFRLKQAKALLGADFETIELPVMKQLMELGYLRPWREKIPAVPVFNQADGEAQRDIGRRLLLDMKEYGGIVTGNLKQEETT